MKNSELIRAGVITLSKKGNKLLVVLGRCGLYSLPKGVIEKGETFIECAQREAYEETGLKVEPIRTRRFIYNDTVLFYTKKIKEEEIKKRETDEVIKVEMREIKELEKMPNLNSSLKRVIKYLKREI